MSKSRLNQDAERNWYASPSSAGLETQPLPVATFTVHLPKLPYRSLAVLTWVLIGGLVLLDLLVPGNINWGLGGLLFALAVCFFVASVWQRSFAFCIPACILAGLSIGLPVVDLLGPVPMLWGLAVGFFSIFFLGRIVFNQREPWPLFPAGALLVTGLFLLIFG